MIMTEEEEQWTEDVSDDEEEDENAAFDLFAPNYKDPKDKYNLKINDSLTLNLQGIKGIKYPHLLQSTGLTLWKGSEALCTYIAKSSSSTLLENSVSKKFDIRGKSVVELGAGLGLCGIVAHKLGASNVMITDGDTETLTNIRRNISNNKNIKKCSDKDHDHDKTTKEAESLGKEQQQQEEEDSTILCKQLRWGKNVDQFRKQYSPKNDASVESEQGGGFDVVMGGDIVYAQGSLEPLFDTVVGLLPEKHGLFLLSYVYRGGATIEDTMQSAEQHGLECLESVEGDKNEASVYAFGRIKS